MPGAAAGWPAWGLLLGRRRLQATRAEPLEPARLPLSGLPPGGAGAYKLAPPLPAAGADVVCKDTSGNTALDLAVNKGRVSDEELFVLLSSPR
jgi:ankyrin repeat protein